MRRMLVITLRLLYGDYSIFSIVSQRVQGPCPCVANAVHLGCHFFLKTRRELFCYVSVKNIMMDIHYDLRYNNNKKNI